MSTVWSNKLRKIACLYVRIYLVFLSMAGVDQRRLLNLVLFCILLICATQQPVWSQSHRLVKTSSSIEQAAGQKEYSKASQYAYEICDILSASQRPHQVS